MEARSLTELKYKKYPIIPELTKEERAELKKSIQDYGYIDAIVLNKKDEILDGNHRAEIWNELGGAKIPVTYVENHPELDNNEPNKEAFQIRRCLTGRTHIKTDKRYKLLARLSDLNTEIAARQHEATTVAAGNTGKARGSQIRRTDDTSLTANQAGVSRHTVIRAKQYVDKLKNEGKDKAEFPRQYVRPTPEPKIPTIDDICLEIEGYILKAGILLQSDKFKENFKQISPERRNGLAQAMRLFLIEFQGLAKKLNLKLLEE